MKFLPLEEIKLRSHLSVDEAEAVLAKQVIPQRPFHYFGMKRSVAQPYEGGVGRGSFRIKRIITYRNSFLPIVSGRLQAEDNGTLVKVKMRMHTLVVGFLGMWLGLFVAILASVSAGQPNQVFLWIVPLAVLLLGYPVVLWIFGREAGKARQFLKQLWAAEEVN